MDRQATGSDNHTYSLLERERSAVVLRVEFDLSIGGESAETANNFLENDC